MVAQNLILLRSLSDLMSYRSRDLHNKILSISHIFFPFSFDWLFYKNKKFIFTKIMSKTFINLGIKCILGKLWQESCQQQMILRKQRQLRNSEKEASLTPSVFFLLACFLLI